MVQIDVPVAFAIGGLFADAANVQLRAGRAEYYFRAFWQNNIYQIFFFSWVPLYFVMNYFGWETTHMWWHADSVMAYPFFVPILVIVFFAAANGGFLLGYALIKQGKLVANRVVYLGITAYALGWVFLQTHTTFYLGTYEQWKAGQAPIFYQDSMFLFMLIATIVWWAAGIVIFALRMLRDGKHLDGAV